jgi:archaellin
MRKNSEAATGIGTMIVLIGLILVSVMAAGLLVEMSGIIKAQTEDTGTSAKGETSGKFEVVAAYGVTNSAKTDIDNVYIKIAIAPGSPALQMNETLIEVSNGTVHYTWDWSDSEFFTATSIRDPAGVWTPQCFVDAGSLVKVRLNLGSTVNLETQTELTVKFIPKHGQTTTFQVVMPDTYTDEYVDLY